MALTPKRKKFVEVYAGNGTEAARLAGYQGSDNVLAQAARYLLRNTQIDQAIKARQSKELKPLVASRQDRQTFWSSVMQDRNEQMFARLKASELLGKSEADFTDKVEHSGALTLEQLVVESMKKPEGT